MTNIPKVIHYCWFGRNPLPESAQKCIASWRKFLPDYEIIEWNEDNYDVNKIAYTAEAYAARKYAFVSDYARFDILYQHGGLYFDTDVEVIKPFDDIVERGAFMGCEFDADRKHAIAVNPGLGLGASANMPIYRSVLDYYSNRHFVKPNGENDITTVVAHTTSVLKQFGLEELPGIQEVENIVIYPKNYFNPLDDLTGKLVVTSETHSIHWYSKTWLTVSPLRVSLSRFSHRVLGTNFIPRLKKFLKNK